MISWVLSSLRQSVLALLGGQLVKGLGLLLAQEGLVVVLVAVSIVVDVITEISLVMDALLLSGDSKGHGD